MRLYLLDTNMVSYILTGRSPMARRRLRGLSGEEMVAISVITEAELHYGVAKSCSDRRRLALDGFLKRIRIFPWESGVAAAYGVLRANLEKRGRMLGPLDMQIAAHAIALGATLVTRDKGFEQIGDLFGTENWATDL